MSGEMKAEPPKLPGEVWRGLDGDEDVCAVTIEDGETTGWIWSPSQSKWEDMSADGGAWLQAHVFSTWALHERAVAAAERELRKAVENEGIEMTLSAAQAIAEGQPDAEAVRELEAAKRAADEARNALRALGVDP